MAKKKDPYAEMYSQLVGKTVVGLANDSEGGFYGLILSNQKKEKTVAWIQCDEEGNAPGFLQIEPMK